jgi:hypothetical protein
MHSPESELHRYLFGCSRPSYDQWMVHGSASNNPVNSVPSWGQPGIYLDTSPATGFGYVEAQTALPTEGFSNSSFSGALSATTDAPAISANVNATDCDARRGRQLLRENEFKHRNGTVRGPNHSRHIRDKRKRKRGGDRSRD